MESAASSAFKSGRVVKDTCAVYNARLLLAVLLSDEPAFIFGLVFVLPVTTFEAFHIFGDVLEIFLVKKMRTKRTTTMH